MKTEERIGGGRRGSANPGEREGNERNKTGDLRRQGAQRLNGSRRGIKGLSAGSEEEVVL